MSHNNDSWRITSSDSQIFNKILHYMSHVTLQIVKHVKGHEINEANRAIYLTASESQALVRLC